MLTAVILIVAASLLVALVLLAVFLHRRARVAESRARELHDVAVRYDGIRGMEAALHQLDRARADLDARMQAARNAHESERAAMQAESQRSRAQLDAQMQNVRAAYESEHTGLTAELNRLRRDLAALEELEYLHSIGLYEPRYDFETADDYRAALERIRDKQKAAVKAGRAATCGTNWTVDGSRAKGEQKARNSIKLVLRAFNGDCDAAIAKVKYNNIHALAERIRKARETVNRMGRVGDVSISEEYLQLKLDELSLFHEHAEKKQEEKEEQRRIKEQMREEARAQQELERAQQQAEDDERRYADALEQARVEVDRSTGAKHQKLLDKVAALQHTLARAAISRDGNRGRMPASDVCWNPRPVPGGQHATQASVPTPFAEGRGAGESGKKACPAHPSPR